MSYFSIFYFIKTLPNLQTAFLVIPVMLESNTFIMSVYNFFLTYRDSIPWPMKYKTSLFSFLLTSSPPFS